MSGVQQHPSIMATTTEGVDVESSPFEISDSEVGSGKFLGLLDRKYVKSLHGAAHGVASVGSLVLGNWLFLMGVVLGRERRNTPFPVKIVFYSSTLISASVVYLFYWHKVQSWQLATTSKEEKGITSTTLQNLNRGRDIGLIVHSIYPLVCLVVPSIHLHDRAFSSAVAILLLTLSAYSYMLIKDYAKAIFVVYGAYTMGLGLSILQCDTIAGLEDKYPTILDHSDKMAYMVISCVQFGFLLYYLYSRRLVRKETVQQLCKNYHPVMIIVWLGRLQADRWWKTLPIFMLIVPMITSLLLALFVFKIVKSLLLPKTKKQEEPAVVETPEKEKEQSTNAATTARRRRSSIFEVTSQASRRRSSILESIDVGLFEDVAD